MGDIFSSSSLENSARTPRRNVASRPALPSARALSKEAQEHFDFFDDTENDDDNNDCCCGGGGGGGIEEGVCFVALLPLAKDYYTC